MEVDVVDGGGGDAVAVELEEVVLDCICLIGAETK